MGAPLSVKTNNYRENEKKSDIMTPLEISQFLFDLLEAKQQMTIVDPCCGTGNLLKPWKVNHTVMGYDVVNQVNMSKMVYAMQNFLEIEESFLRPDLVICNPPFNRTMKWAEDTKDQKVDKRMLIPDVFLQHIFKLYGEDVPVALFVPMGFRLNQRRHSKRFRYYRDKCKAKITSIVSLPLDSFPGVEFHMELLLWNMPELEPHYFLSEEYIPVYKKQEATDGQSSKTD